MFLLDVIELQLPNANDLAIDEHKSVTKHGTTTKETTGVLIDDHLEVCIDYKDTSGCFYFFDKCFGIANDSELPFFKEGDSGSGVFFADPPMKPLGIAFAYGCEQTAVCDIRQIVEAFDVTLLQRHTHEPMDIP